MEKKQSNIFKALIKAQHGFKEIIKTKEAYGYKYAPLEEVWKAVKDSLYESELCIYYTLDEIESKIYLSTHLSHVDGETISSKLCIPQTFQSKSLNTLQAFGSALTYLKRYALCSMLCVHAEEDTDGNIPEALALQLKAKASHDSAYSAKTMKLLQKYSVDRISNLPKKAEAAARKVLSENQNEQKAKG